MPSSTRQIISKIFGTARTSPQAEVPAGAQVELLMDRAGRIFVRQLDGLCIAMGHADSWDYINKFGAAPDFDTGDGEVTIWDGAEDDAAWENMVYDYSTTAAIDSISSSNDGDTQDIEIQGLDANFNLVTQTITLTGQTRAALTTDLIRVFRAKNVGSVDLAGNVFVYENDTTVTVPGVPDDPALIRAVIHAENNQTEMAIFTIPAGYTGFLWNFYGSIAGASKDSNYIIKLYARPDGQVFQLKHRMALSDSGTSSDEKNYKVPLRFEAKTDIHLTAEMTAAGASAAAVSGGFYILIIPN